MPTGASVRLARAMFGQRRAAVFIPVRNTDFAGFSRATHKCAGVTIGVRGVSRLNITLRSDVRRARAPLFTTRSRYQIAIRECGKWEGSARRDAFNNWRMFRDRHADLLEWVRLYRRDRYLSINGVDKNPRGTLDGLLWIASGQSDNGWLWDFEDRFQRAFLRRGVLQYCELITLQIEWRTPEDSRQLCFDF